MLYDTCQCGETGINSVILRTEMQIGKLFCKE